MMPWWSSGNKGKKRWMCYFKKTRSHTTGFLYIQDDNYPLSLNHHFMKPLVFGMSLVIGLAAFLFTQCTQKPTDFTAPDAAMARDSFGGFGSQVLWGEHLVTICGCHDCHTPKKMTAHGPDLDSTLLLSGHPAQMPLPEVDRKSLESQGLAMALPTLTGWMGPWGVSFTANLTSDETGIGTWQESQFINALRNGKFKGLDASRTLLPPMPWQSYRHMTDDELKAIFAYLKSTKPIANIVPDALPPLAAMQ